MAYSILQSVNIYLLTVHLCHKDLCRQFQDEELMNN